MEIMKKTTFGIEVYEVTVPVLSNLCRLCGCLDGNCVNLFCGEGAEEDLIQKIKNAVQITVTKDDDLPKKVCFVCRDNIVSYDQGYDEFYQQCHVTQEKLREFLSIQLALRKTYDKSQDVGATLLDENKEKRTYYEVDSDGEDKNSEMAIELRSVKGKNTAVLDENHGFPTMQVVSAGPDRQQIIVSPDGRSATSNSDDGDADKDPASSNPGSAAVVVGCADSQGPRGRGTYCETRKLNFKSMRTYRQHIRNRHNKLNPITFKCPHCEYAATKTNTLRAHIRSKHSTSSHKFSCQYCNSGRRFKVWRNLAAHLKKFHPDLPKPPKPGPSATSNNGDGDADKDPASSNPGSAAVVVGCADNQGPRGRGTYCESCKFNFKSMRTYRQHIRDRHNKLNPKTFKCPHCEYAATKTNTLRAHIRSKHSSSSHKFSCQYCNTERHFKVWRNFAAHLKKFHPDLPKPPKPGPSATSNNGDGDADKGQGPRGRDTYCETCKFTFKSMRTYRQHIRDRHNKLNPKTFKCPHCEYAATKTNSLRDHIIFKHSTSSHKLFSCQYCNSERHFKVWRNLTAHLKKFHPDQPKPPKPGPSTQENHSVPMQVVSAGPDRQQIVDSPDGRSATSNSDNRDADKDPASSPPGSEAVVVGCADNQGSRDRDTYCETCRFNYKSMRTYQQHIRERHNKLNPKKFPCPHCDYIATKTNSLAHHIRSKHSTSCVSTATQNGSSNCGETLPHI